MSKVARLTSQPLNKHHGVGGFGIDARMLVVAIPVTALHALVIVALWYFANV